MYMTYEQYKEYGGTLDEAAFNRYGYQAHKIIEAETHRRIKTPSEAVLRCIARVCDLLASADPAIAGRVSSFSHDGLSQSFAVPSAADISAETGNVIYTYLIHETAEDGTPLLYMGVDSYD